MAREQKSDDVLYGLIEKANKLVRRSTQDRFTQARLRLTNDQWQTLKAIDESPGITQIEIAEQLFKDRASVTRILELMQNRKLVKKVPGEDKRSFNLTLTALGEKNLKLGLPEVRTVRKQGINNLSDREFETLKKLLARVVSNLE